MGSSNENWTRAQWQEYQRTGKAPQAPADVATPPPAEPLPSKAEVQAEKKDHVLICRELNRREIEYIHAPMNKRSVLPVGWPDFTIFPKGGRMWLAEMKTATGVVSKDQKERIAKLEADGYAVYVLRSFEEFKAVLLNREIADQP